MSPRSLEMMLAGYAATRLKITLSAFQLEALVQATSSGKSVCFQIPSMMMDPGKYAVVVVRVNPFSFLQPRRKKTLTAPLT